MPRERRSPPQVLDGRNAHAYERMLTVVGMLRRGLLAELPVPPSPRHLLRGHTHGELCQMLDAEAAALGLEHWRCGHLDHVWPIAHTDVLALGEGGMDYVLCAHNLRVVRG